MTSKPNEGIKEVGVVENQFEIEVVQKYVRGDNRDAALAGGCEEGFSKSFVGVRALLLLAGTCSTTRLGVDAEWDPWKSL